jgi:hypothetical protein
VDLKNSTTLLTLAEFEIFYLCLAKEYPKTTQYKRSFSSRRRKILPKKFMPIIRFSNELYRDLVKQNRNNIMLTELSENF